MPIPLFDAHCDTLSRNVSTKHPFYAGGDLRRNSGHLDLERLHTTFSPSAQFFAVFDSWDSEESGKLESLYPRFQTQYALFARTMEENGDLAVHCRTAAEAEAANAAGKTAAFLSVEGAELLDCDEGKLADAWEKGVRMVNLTWNFENALSGSNAEAPGKGLTVRGRSFVCKMQQLGMIVDVSHLSDPGFWDVAELSQAAGTPFIASHSNARALCPHKRNLTDEQFTAIIKSRGVAGLNLCDKFLAGRPTLDDAAAHIEHFLALGGEENVAIGGDWDGCDLCPGVEQITDIGLLYERLLRRNYSETLVQAIFYNNLMRVVREVCTI